MKIRRADIPVGLSILANWRALSVVVRREAIEGIGLLNGFIFKICRNAI